MKYLKLFLGLTGILILFNTCEKDESDPLPSPQEETTVYNVTLTKQTVFIDSLLVEDLVRVDTSEYVYYFNSDDPRISNLENGDILMIYGLALRKVSHITRTGGETRVETSYATLNEAIKDGEISWKRNIDFRDGIIPIIEMNGKEFKLKSASADGFEFELPLGEYKYRIKFSLSDKKADVEFEVSKGLGGNITAKFKATGSIENFYSSADMKFKDSKLTQFKQQNSNLKGELTLNLTVAGSGRDNVVLDFPVVLLKFPTMVGPVPVDINVKVLFVMNCSVPVDGSSRVDVKFSYNSTTGVQYNGTTVSADASIGDHSMNKNITETGASSAIAANFGLAFPRLEIGIFKELIVPWIQTAFLIGGDYTFTPACQQARSQFIGACGVNLSFLGFGYNASTTLWQEEKVLLKTGECPLGRMLGIVGNSQK
jgi:hypothetical protein